MFRSFSLAYILPSAGGGGGPNSIVQEAGALGRIGVRVTVAVNAENFDAFRSGYPELRSSQANLVSYDSRESLAAIMAEADIVCATTALSVRLVEAALSVIAGPGKRPKVAYYVQDYEPLFYERNSEKWKDAFASYKRIRGAALFAKTDWLCAMVRENHDVPIARVKASVDHEIYYPRLRQDDLDPKITVIAMLRSKTKRRAPIRTARIVSWLAAEHSDAARVEVFGATDDELAQAGIDPPPSCFNHGRLRRTEVPAVLRGSDLFLDLSDYQAFGRTAIEAMASGCTPIVPVLGGATEYAQNGRNAFVVDTRSDAAIKEVIVGYLRMPESARAVIKANGYLTASEFSVVQAAASELKVFQELLART